MLARAIKKYSTRSESSPHKQLINIWVALTGSQEKRGAADALSHSSNNEEGNKDYRGGMVSDQRLVSRAPQKDEEGNDGILFKNDDITDTRNNGTL